MKKLIIPLLTLAFTLHLDAQAEVVADYIEGEQSAALVTPEIETAASAMLGPSTAGQLLHAMRLQMSKYDADMKTQSGRRAWHGKLLYSEIHTNELCAVEVYSNEVDGVIWRYRLPFKPKGPAQLPRPPRPAVVSTNGIPARLAQARIQTVADKSAPKQVTVEVTGNAP